MHKIAVLGSNGQLGRAICKRVKESGNLIALSRADFDLRQEFTSRLEEIQFDLLINCAAFNNTVAAEESFEEANRVNGYAVKELAQSCQKRGATFVHVSSDYVFDGRKGSSYVEEDLINPLSKYGKSKALGEQFAKQECERHYIFRTASLFGEGTNNFVQKILRSRDNLEIVDDIVMSPTSAESLAGWILEVCDKSAPYGIYHAVNDGAVSWYHFAQEICRLANKEISISAKKSDRNIERPKNSSLDVKKLKSVVGEIPDWKKSLRGYLE